jgi:hypothetical protein
VSRSDASPSSWQTNAARPNAEHVSGGDQLS